jgi:hypothetical protein
MKSNSSQIDKESNLREPSAEHRPAGPRLGCGFERARPCVPMNIYGRGLNVINYGCIV